MPAPAQKPRPKPKPKFKNAVTAAAADTSLIESPFFSDDQPSSLSDRVKMRERSKAGPSGLKDRKSEIIDITDSDSQDELDHFAAPKPNVQEKLTIKLRKPNSTSSLPPSDFPRSTGSVADPPAPDDNDEGLIPPVDVLEQRALSPLSPLPAPKPPVKRKKKAAEEDSGEKPAKRPRAKKAKKDAAADGAPAKPKGQRKKKEEAQKEFKSMEFIDDSGSDVEEMAPLPPLFPQKPVSTLSVPDSQGDDELLVLSAKRKRVEAEDDLASDDGGKKAKLSSAANSKLSSSSKVDRSDLEIEHDEADFVGPRKRAKKLVVASEDEDGGRAKAVGDPKPGKKPTSKKAAAEDGVTEIAAPKPTKRKRKTAVTSESEDVEMDALLETVIEVEPTQKNTKGKRTIVVKDADVPKPTKKIKDKQGPADESEDYADVEMDAPPPPKGKTTKKTVRQTVVNSDEEEPEEEPREDENPRPEDDDELPKSPETAPITNRTSQALVENTRHNISTPNAKYMIGARTKSTPMSEIIARANAHAGSPFPAVIRRISLGSGSAASPYSPHNKFSRSALSRIAPLHPNRKPPPPPPPPAPPKPKTKKQKELEEKWEEEMIEAVGGWEAWQALDEQEQKAARRSKWAREQEGWDD
ncbi:hypothetical protein MKEN_00371500 [Mycena kentingensis (nom. inval.)]|nr:hypothetical protein MKEN_00371500 [Mycena kentingensis (nom. inval.)]